MSPLIKLSKIEAVRMLKDFIREELPEKEWYKNISPHVKGIVFYGSTAKGLNRADSDIDALVIVPLAVEEKYTKGEYMYSFHGREINIVLRSIERLRELAQHHFFEKSGAGLAAARNDAFQAEVFRKSEIVWEADREARELIRKIEEA